MIWNWPTDTGWAWWAALATAFTFAAILLYVVPLVTAVISIGRVGPRLVEDVQRGGCHGRHCRTAGTAKHSRPESAAPPIDDEYKIITLLVSRDLAFSCLIKGHNRVRRRVYNTVRLRRRDGGWPGGS